MPTIDIGRMKPGFRASIKGSPNQLEYDVQPEDILAGRFPKIEYVDYDPENRLWFFRVGRQGVDGPTVTNSDGVIEHGKDMRVTFGQKGASFRFTKEHMPMTTYETYWDESRQAWAVQLPAGMVLKQTDNVLGDM